MGTPTSSPHVSTQANAPIPLWAGRIHLVVDGVRSKGSGSIALELSPEPTIVWKQASPDAVPAVLNSDSGRIVPWGLGVSADYRRTTLSIGTNSKLSFESEGFLAQGIEVGRRKPITGLVFHALNFPGFLGSALELGGTHWSGRTSFGWRGWSVVLDQTNGETALRDQLRATHGYAVTHNGRLTRLDGQPFRVSEGLRRIGELRYLLGFVRGGWCGPGLLSGRDRDDEEAWAQWSVMLVDSAKFRPSIFVWEHPEMLVSLAPGFMRRLAGDAWGESYKRAVELYVAANRGIPIEIGIILAQSALEILAWSTFVRSGRVPPGEFKKNWPASRQIRELLRRARIPTDIPVPLAVLSEVRDVADPKDGPETVASVRNRIVHAPRNRALRPSSSAELVATWQLMLWYADCVLLRLAQFEGSMRSRVDGKVGPLPTASRGNRDR